MINSTGFSLYGSMLRNKELKLKPCADVEKISSHAEPIARPGKCSTNCSRPKIERKKNENLVQNNFQGLKKGKEGKRRWKRLQTGTFI